MCNNYCSRLDVQTLDYAEVAQFAVLEYTKKQIWGKIARLFLIIVNKVVSHNSYDLTIIWNRFTVNLFLLITQFGFCCAYFVFMGYSLDQVSMNIIA